MRSLARVQRGLGGAIERYVVIPGSRERPDGQALAEFALVVPILAFVIAGIIQFGLIFWSQQTLTQIARDTGRWAATQLDCSDTGLVETANDIANHSTLFGFDGSLKHVSASWVPPDA